MIEKLNIYSTSLIGLLLIATVACEEVSTTPAFETTPHIRLLETSSETIVQFVDTLELLLEYEDGDGDLGNEDPDINSLFIKDSRLDQPDAYYIPPLSPEGSDPAITGSFSVFIEPIFLLGSGNQETSTFSIYLVDRAGNESNTIETPKITIVK